MTKLRLVEIWGGPCAGKSTTAAGLFYNLKLRHNPGEKLSVELVHKYAKAITWELHHLYPEGSPPFEAQRRALLARQAKLFAEQYERVSRLRGQVDLVISDSPIWLSAEFADKSLKKPARSPDPDYENLA